MTAGAVRAGTDRLLWLPAVAAVYIVVRTPAAPVGWIVDTSHYLGQADAIRSGEIPDGRYPPGFPSLLVAGDVFGLTPSTVVKATTCAVVLAVVVAARRVGGPVAGAVAGLLCCGSPWLVAASRFVMSDPLGVLLAVSGLVAVLARRPGYAVAATVAGVLTRVFSVVGVAALLPLGRKWVAVAGLTAVAGFGVWQAATPGSGYSVTESFAPGNITAEVIGDGNWLVDGTPAKAGTPDSPGRDWPNLVAYPLMVVGVTYVFGPPFLPVIGLWALWRRRCTEGAQYVGWWLAGSLVVLFPYYAQSPRFLAPAMMLLAVYTAVGIADLGVVSREVVLRKPSGRCCQMTTARVSHRGCG